MRRGRRASDLNRNEFKNVPLAPDPDLVMPLLPDTVKALLLQTVGYPAEYFGDHFLEALRAWWNSLDEAQRASVGQRAVRELYREVLPDEDEQGQKEAGGE